MKIFRRLYADISAATAVEYGVLTAMIAVGMLVGVYSFSDALDATFTTLRETFTGATGSPQ